jgi:glycosyltransferase involved in cell wall biosynthesis
MKDPLVTVVTPCRNPGARLTRCIDSVATQSYRRIEHVIVDGASTDATVELLSGREGVRWVSEPDSGQSNAINKGLRMMNGEIFTWLNADDTLKPDAVRLAVAAFAEDPALGWVHGMIEYRRGRRKWLVGPTAHPTLQQLAYKNLINQPGTFIASRAMQVVGEIDESFSLAMDVDLWVRLLSAGLPGRFLRETLAVFEIHDESKTGSVNSAEFLYEEYRAFQKAGLESEARIVHRRWEDVVKGAEVLSALNAGNLAGAQSAAKEVLASELLSRKQRLFVSIAARSPQVARVAARMVHRL